MRVGEIFDPVEDAREESYNYGYKEGFIDGYRAKCNKLKRYEWHNIMKNPKDLPNDNVEVLCACGDNKEVYYRLLTAKRNKGFQHVRFSTVIAWKYIDKFEFA